MTPAVPGKRARGRREGERTARVDADVKGSDELAIVRDALNWDGTAFAGENTGVVAP